MTGAFAFDAVIYVPRRRRSALGPPQPGAGGSIGGVHGSDASSPPAPGNIGAPAPSPARGNNEPAPSPSSSRGTGAEEEKRRRVKGKMVVVDESPANAGGGNKLMNDAISSYDANASSNKPSSKPETSGLMPQECHPFWFGLGRGGMYMTSAGSDLLPASLYDIPVVTDRLRTRLRDLGVSPTRVYGKMMSHSDRVGNQARLLMSCKSCRESFPLDAFFTAQEKATATELDGLMVLALDRAGNEYEGMKCRYLDSNSGYRIIGEWGPLLIRNGLVLPKKKGGGGNHTNGDVVVDLWPFRFAPGGKVGIVVVHYRRGDAPHADAAFEEDIEKPQKIRRRGAAAEDEEKKAACDGNDIAMEDAANDAIMENEEAGDGNDIAMEDAANGAIMENEEAGDGNDIAMENSANDAIMENEEAGNNGQGEAAAPGTLIGATTMGEEAGSEKEEAVTLSLDQADGANEDEAGAHGKATSPSSPFNNADAAKEAEGSAPPSSDGEADEKETDERSKALQVLLSSCKQDVLQAADILMEISRGVW